MGGHKVREHNGGDARARWYKGGREQEQDGTRVRGHKGAKAGGHKVKRHNGDRVQGHRVQGWERTRARWHKGDWVQR